MNKLNFLNKLRKRHLDRERKKRLKGYIKKINECYVKGTILELYVANEMDYNIFNESVRIDFEIYNSIIKYLNNLNIKYEIITKPLYSQKEEPVVVKIKFIYEEKSQPKIVEEMKGEEIIDLARVLEEGIRNLILNKLFKDEDELGSALAQMLELEFADLDLQVEMSYFKKFSLDFELNNKKYYLSVRCKVLINKQLIPYTCIVLEKPEKDGWAK